MAIDLEQKDKSGMLVFRGDALDAHDADILTDALKRMKFKGEVFYFLGENAPDHDSDFLSLLMPALKSVGLLYEGRCSKERRGFIPAPENTS